MNTNIEWKKNATVKFFMNLLCINFKSMCASNILACQITGLFCFGALWIHHMVIFSGNTREYKYLYVMPSHENLNLSPGWSKDKMPFCTCKQRLLHFYNADNESKTQIFWKYFWRNLIILSNNKTCKVQSLRNSFRPRVCCYGRWKEVIFDLEGSYQFRWFCFLSTKPYLIRGTVDEGTTGFIVYLTGSNRIWPDSLPSFPQMS